MIWTRRRSETVPSNTNAKRVSHCHSEAYKAFLRVSWLAVAGIASQVMSGYLRAIDVDEAEVHPEMPSEDTLCGWMS